MISLCTVLWKSSWQCAKPMLQSLEAQNSGLIDEIVLVDVNPEHDVSLLSEFTRIPIRYFSIKNVHPRLGHVLGLHKAIDESNSKYLLLADPDVIYLMKGFDRFYFDIYQKFDLYLLGMEHHHRPAPQAFGRFPTVVNMLVDRNRFPGDGFLRGKLRVDKTLHVSGIPYEGLDDYNESLDGKYLMYGPIDEYRKLFPNRTGSYDIGCNLLIWLHQMNGRWLSFRFNNRYYTTRNANNFGMKGDLGDRRLLFHHRGGVTRPDAPGLLQKVFEQSSGRKDSGGR